MPRLRNRWVRVALAAALLALIAVVAYQVGIYLWANRHYHTATEALARYDYWQAGEDLDRYLAIYPNDGAVRLLAAQTARRRGDFPEALRLLRQAEQQGAAADALTTERQLLRLQGGDLTDAGQLAQFCTDHAADPETAVALEVLIEGSLAALHVGLAKWSIDLWLKHRTADVDRAQGLVWRGRLHELTQDFPQALADFQQAVELAPDHAQARLRLAEALIREEPWKAAPHLEWLGRRRPGDPQVRFLTARLRRNLGQPEEAGQLLDAILAVTPNKVPVLVERGRVAMDLNQPQEAERWLQRALTLAPGQREVHLALGDCLRQAGRLDEAKRHQDQALEIETKLKQKLEEMGRKKAGGSQ